MVLTCASFDAFYKMEDDYGRTAKLMGKSKFMAMKRGLSSSNIPGDNQFSLNISYDFPAGEDRKDI